jgi:hypothetical protein
MRKLAFASFVVVSLMGFGCNKEGGGSSTTTTTAAGGETKPASTGGGDIGVPECDDYLKKMESCLSKMPAEARSASENAFKQSKDAWKQAAATEAGKASLKQGCQSALDALAQNPMCK